MAFVPIVPTTPVQTPSPRTRELAVLLTKVLDEYQKAHPSVTGAEVRAAMRMAVETTGAGRKAVAVTLVLILGLGVAALGLGLFMAGGGTDLMNSESMPMIVMALIFFVAILLGVIKIATR